MGASDFIGHTKYGVSLMGYEVVAMDEDYAGKSEVRKWLRRTAQRLENGLKNRIEGTSWQPFDPKKMEDAVNRLRGDVFGTPGSFIVTGSSIVDLFWAIGDWFADYFIGQSGPRFLGVDRNTHAALPASVRPMVAPLMAGTPSLTLTSAGGAYRLAFTLRETRAFNLV